MVEEFIRKRGVTPCPASGSPEMAALHIERQKAYAQQPTKGWRAGRKWAVV